MTGEVVRHGTVPPVRARANWGRWIADCPRCGSALAVGRGEHRLGALLHDETGAAVAWLEGCWDCGARTEVLWPDEDFVAAVERLLMLRPDPNTRSWEPGETLHDLMRDNADHGIFTEPALEAAPGTELMSVTDGAIIVDNMPATPALSPSTYRRAIGA
jgi:hypothetical protein